MGFDGGTGCHNRTATFIKAATLIIRNSVDLERGGPSGLVGSRQAVGVAWTPSAAALGFNGAGGPVPWRNRRTALSTLWARAAIYPSQSTLHNTRSRHVAIGLGNPVRELAVPAQVWGLWPSAPPPRCGDAAIELEPINNLSRYSRGVAKLNLGEYDFSSAHGQRRDSRPECQVR